MYKTDRDKRRFKRYNVDGIHGNMLYSADVNVVNISIDGASIETTKRLTIDKEYTLKIKFKDTVLNLKGSVAWSTLSHNETRKNGEVVPVYKAGIKFDYILTANSSELMKFIYENRTESIEKRLLGVRFKVKRPNDAIIDCPHEYTIKKISLSGMLIESETLFDIESLHEMEICLQQSVMPVTGRIVNCVETVKDNITRFDIGIEFIKISDEDRSLLKTFLESLDKDGK